MDSTTGTTQVAVATRLRPDVEFSKTIDKAVVEGIESVVGPNGAFAILFHSKLLDTANDPRKVHEALSMVLSSGSKVVEDSIAKKFLRTLALPDHIAALEFERFYSLAVTINRVRARDVDTV